MQNQHSIKESDEVLWTKLRRGNKVALRALFLRYHDSLFQYGLSICSTRPLIKDCLQELFFQLWKKRETLSKVQKVKGYLWIAFRRRLMRKLKEENKNGSITEQYLPERKKISVERTIIQKEQQANRHKLLHKVLNILSPREREVLFLKYFEGMSYSEIEEIMGIEYQTARNYIYRAISRLRDALEEEEATIVICMLASIFCFDALFLSSMFIGSPPF